MNEKTANEEPTSYLTSRLPVYFWHPDIKKQVNYCDIRLDRITIAGTFHAEQYSSRLKGNGWQETTQIDYRPTQYKLIRKGKNSKNKTIAELSRNPYQSNGWRMDTSNHLQDSEKEKIRNIVKLFQHPHLTRIDIAFDFINFDNANMNNRFYKVNTSQTIIIDKKGTVETIYCGKRASNLQYRYYNKLLEQQKKRQAIPLNCKSWERLELQARGNMASEWIIQAQKMLQCFKRPNLVKLAKTSPKKYLVLLSIIEHPENMNLLSKRSKSRYRKLIKNNQGFDTTYSDLALKVLNEKADSLIKEIEDFMA